MRIAICVLAASFALVGLTHAQPLGTDLYVTAGSNLVRISPTGIVTTVATGPGSLNMVAMANDNNDVIIATRTSPTMLRVDPMTATTTSIVGGAPFQSEIDYFNPMHTGEFVVSSNNGLYAVDESGTVRTITAGTPLVNLQGVIQDLTDGTIAVGDIDSSARGIYRVGLDGTVITLLAPNSGSAFSLTQDHRDGRLIVGAGAGGTVLRIDQATNTWTTITTSAGNANSIAFDRWSGNGEIVVGSTTTNRIDISGNIITTHPGVTRTGACFDAERNLVSIRTAVNRYALNLNVPGQAGRSFVVGVSATSFRPGIPIDTRVVQLALDPVLIASVNGALNPFLTGNIGTLGATERASATLDLSSFGSLAGLRLWAAAVTIDPAAPSGIGVITKPIVLVME